jgi:uncharacterized membrane protein YagU involved in acid resistance
MGTIVAQLVIVLGVAVAGCFFQVLRIFQFIVDLAWCVVMPIWHELKVGLGECCEAEYRTQRVRSFYS